MASDSTTDPDMRHLESEAIRKNEPASPRLPSISAGRYEALLRLARALHRHFPNHTLTPVSLAHDALIKIHAWPDLPSTDETRFLTLAARAMRQLLVDRLRQKLSVKHGGGLKFVPLSEGEGTTAPASVEFLDYNRALDELAELNQRHALAVEYMDIFGYTVEETAAILEVAPRTVQRDLRAAQAWIASRMGIGREK